NMGKKTVGFVTDMSQPLGHMVGNWLEVVESVDCLRGKNVPGLMEVTYVLGGAMVWLGGKTDSIEEGMKLCKAAIYSGKAYEKFLQIVARQGGDVSFVEQPQKYPPARHVVDVKSFSGGYVTDFDTRKIGLLGIELGAGRKKVDGIIDPAAGIILMKKIGAPLTTMETIATIYTSNREIAQRAASELASCIHIAESPVAPPVLVQAYLDGEGVRHWTSPTLY
ncbi:MAG: thymidine phosphorylase, partial [Bacteroidota bacterium]